MSCSIVSMTNVGQKFIIKGGPRNTYMCRKAITCTCDSNTPNPGRTWELGCWGEEGEQELLWGQNVEVCYTCESENGCIFDYCDVKLFQYTTIEQIPCTALDGNDCKCPKNPDLETVDNPCG